MLYNLILAASFMLVWDQEADLNRVVNWELWTWVNNGQVEKHIVSTLPTQATPYQVEKDATIGDTFYAKVRACEAAGCSAWSNQVSKQITELGEITLTSPSNITIKVIIK